MTEREIFDTVKAHLLKQGRRSDVKGYCLYRGPNGTKCAIGCLIPDELYNPQIEMLTIDKLKVYYDTLNNPTLNNSIGPFTESKLRLMRELQRIHDKCAVDNWEKELNKLGETL